ncbi:10815_t:CDS:2 [Paraglomus brasilianum]|uniref:10815_t:CDS:1 n=1 Tax=Paraglomus brasilianum TaxID=144538 RepID=A0A9N8YV91_9GLOM|nr:10815_t:CDS:2 [Paraglomus brasilianum]
MGSASPPDSSPTRIDKSENISTDQGAQSLTLDNANDRSDSSDTVIRKGRGTFRAGSDTQQEQKPSRPPRGRDIDPTAQRQYPSKSNDKSIKQGHRKSKSESRRGSNGIFQPASESGDSATEAISADDMSRLNAAFESTSINDNNSSLADNVSGVRVQGNATIQTQNLEEWERNADGGERVNTPTSPADGEAKRLDGQRSDGGNYNSNSGGNNNTNKPPFKKGHKKSKSSRIEFNFDPDAYEGSTRILDVFGFPATFKTHNLHEIFHEYENMRGGYRIKWMDDTRALIIFEHPATARKAYLDNVANPLASVKPYDGPTDFLQKNANNANNAIPPRARPQTTDVVARRLVHGALGVRGPRSPEQRQAERQLFQNARGN